MLSVYISCTFIKITRMKLKSLTGEHILDFHERPSNMFSSTLVESFYRGQQGNMQFVGRRETSMVPRVARTAFWPAE